MTSDIDKPTNVFHKGQGYTLEQTSRFAVWLDTLRDRVGRARILKRLVRLADGNFGDAKPVGDGVSEVRLFFGPGYRVYFTIRDDVIILLLTGGDNDSQFRDIALAKQLASEDRNDDEDDPL